MYGGVVRVEDILLVISIYEARHGFTAHPVHVSEEPAHRLEIHQYDEKYISIPLMMHEVA